ncbi:class I SAM-dependent methyltransferase [Hyalangium versicolor]|uniref:class I SAM-dependent methyltransferase n=1 Tax=Hyalangium versicolor TaxID=2861190 RepID=UPI001CCCDE04|nr:class I SAM-dependent methyltransferase [Hyalangium versicolor]
MHMHERASPLSCPICRAADAREVLRKEFNISCNCYFEGRRQYPTNEGSVLYVECQGCGFWWAPELHGWSPQTFKRRIYNEEYRLADPPFVFERPTRLAAWVARFVRPGMRVLDYGGGEGLLARTLREVGIDAVSWDPFYDDASEKPAGSFDLVTCFEVVEHVPDQRRLFFELASLSRGGVCIFSTLVRPERHEGDWWYASPRNGHISLHSANSMRRVCEDVGLALRDLSSEVHVMARTPSQIAQLDLPYVMVNGTPEHRLDGLL